MITDNVLVDVVVITYNHEKYISDCLSSILSQNTSFGFRVIIGDDYSTDGTREILLSYKKQYLEKIELIFHPQNSGISNNYKSVFNMTTAPYVAICEGDDFWIDNNKLQRQVDFLISHSDYGFIGSNDYLLSNGKLTSDYYYLAEENAIGQEGGICMFGDVFNYAIYGPVTRTVTICFRRALIEGYIDAVSKGDYSLQAVLASQSKFAKIMEECAVYRTDSGVSSKYSKTYNRFYIDNLQVLSDLFPSESQRLSDRMHYVELKDAFYRFDYNSAKRVRKQITSLNYQHKYYYRFFHGPISFYVLSVIFRIKNTKSLLR